VSGVGFGVGICVGTGLDVGEGLVTNIDSDPGPDPDSA
jgi:hypothetical protein